MGGPISGTFSEDFRPPLIRLEYVYYNVISHYAESHKSTDVFFFFYFEVRQCSCNGKNEKHVDHQNRAQFSGSFVL